VRLVTYNSQYTCGRDERYDTDRIVRTIRDDDVIALQEVENFWDRSGNASQSAAIGEALPDHFSAWGPTVDVLKVSGEEGRRPGERRRRQFGNMVLSRYPILQIRNHLYPKFTTLGPHTIQRGALEVVVDAPLGPLRIYSTHLDHLSARHRMIQLEHLLAIHERAISDGPAIAGRDIVERWREPPDVLPMPSDAILMGDFNFTPTSPEYDRIAGPLHPVRGRLPDAAGFVDAFAAAGHGEDEGPTFLSDAAAGTGKRIDYVFASARLAARVHSAAVDLSADGSDHQPVRVQLD